VQLCRAPPQLEGGGHQHAGGERDLRDRRAAAGEVRGGRHARRQRERRGGRGGLGCAVRTGRPAVPRANRPPGVWRCGSRSGPRRPRPRRPPAARRAAPGLPPREPSAAPPAPGRGGLSGLYTGVIRSLVVPGPGSPASSGIYWTPQRDWMTFFPDGRVFLGLPPTGVGQGFDWAVECPPRPSWCATYAVDGNRVTLRWLSGETRVLTRRHGMLWTEDGSSYRHLPSLDGLRLDGRYMIPGKEAYAPARIAFTRDGQFLEEGLLEGISWNSSDQGDAARRIRAVPRGEGTYEIRSNALAPLPGRTGGPREHVPPPGGARQASARGDLHQCVRLHTHAMTRPVD
jgi:hypothetical protein